MLIAPVNISFNLSLKIRKHKPIHNFYTILNLGPMVFEDFTEDLEFLVLEFSFIEDSILVYTIL